MAITDETHQLIKTLNKNEKRSFKLHSKLTNGEKTYIKLFDTLENMDYYDGKLLNKHFPGKDFNLSYEKNYLQNNLLKMLRNNPSDDAHFQSILLNMSEIEILFSKGLYKMAFLKTEKAKKQASHFECFGLLYEILNIERKICLLSRDKKNDCKIWTGEFANLRKLQNNLSEYIVINHELHSLGVSQGAMLDKNHLIRLKKLCTTGVMSGIKKALSMTAKMYFFNHKLSYNILTGNVDKAIFYSKQMYNIYNNSMLIEKHPQNYISVLSNHIILLTEKQNYKEAREWLKALEDFPQSHKLHIQNNLSSWKFQLTTNHRLNFYIETGDFEEGEKWIADIKIEMGKLSTFLNKYYKIVFQFHFAYIYFGCRKYNECIRELQDLIAEDGTNLAEDYKSYSKILLLMCHYEKGNKEIYSYLYKQLRLHLLKGIQKEIVDNILNETSPELFLNKYMKHPDKLVSQNYINISAWLRSKVEKITLSEAIQKSMKKA